MHWLFLLISALCFGLALIRSMPGWIVFLLLLASLGFLVAWALGLLSARISSSSRDASHIMTGEELRQLREQLEARKAAATPAEAGDKREGSG